MGNVTLNGSTSGSITLAPVAVAGSNTITLPATTGTVALTANPTFTGTTTVSNLAMNGSSSGTTTLSPSATASGTVTIPAGTGTVAVQGVSTNIVSGTALSTNGLTTIPFTGIPSWVKRITIMFNAVTPNGTANPIVQLGVGSTPTTTGYNALSSQIATGVGTINVTTGFPLYLTVATEVFHGHMIFTNVSGNIWVCSGVSGSTYSTAITVTTGGSVTLSGTLGMIQLTSVGAANTFGTGSINILYE